VTRRRHTRNRQAEEPQALVRHQQQIIETGVSHEESVEDFKSPFTNSYMLVFDEIEQRASERLQQVVRTIDESLKI
jgi:hypothetical protein